MQKYDFPLIMQLKLTDWIDASRPRTLPLALSSIMLGGFLSYFSGHFRWDVTLLAMLTTLFLQILSNFANDYGDYSHGVDNNNRSGPERSIQKGSITQRQMKVAIIIMALLSLLTGGLLIGTSFHYHISFRSIIFFAMGIVSIAAAVYYTIGKNPYGYFGLGDLFVFIFFGLIAVGGTFYLNTHYFDIMILLPAASIGMLSVGVLNLNNLRDHENDKKSGKKTIVVKIGPVLAKKYHAFLISLPFIFLIIYSILSYKSYWQFLFVVLLPLLFINLRALKEEPEELDPYLKKLAISSLTIVMVFGLGLVLAHIL